MSEEEAGWAESARRMVAMIPGIPAPIADAMRRVPRHRFIPRDYLAEAYLDEPVPLPYGDATVSAPHMVALQLEFLTLAPNLRVLEVGVGFGYLAALVAELTAPGGRVFGVDLEPGLVREARQRLDATDGGDRIRLRASDGRLGWPEVGPFDRIVVSCATPELFETWRRQLVSGGILVAPLGPASSQELVRHVNTPDGGVLERGPACRFVPLRGRLPSDI